MSIASCVACSFGFSSSSSSSSLSPSSPSLPSSPRIMSRVQRQLFSVLLVVLAIAIDNVVATDLCKKTLRTVFFDRCRVRNKRDTMSWLMDSFGDFSSEHQEPAHEHAVKRQIMSIREIFVSSRVPYYYSPHTANYARHEYIPAVPPDPVDIYRVGQPFRSRSLPQESHSEVGFDMSYEEMLELFDELYARMPRSTISKSREDMQKKYLSLFEECCKNVELCRMKKDCPDN